jgi:hypothetical protein
MRLFGLIVRDRNDTVAVTDRDDVLAVESNLRRLKTDVHACRVK